MTSSTDNGILTPVSSAFNPTAAAENKTTRRSDHDLQLARRIDWRFLLPEPYLRRVAYLGPESGTLPTALRHFSESFQIISANEKGKFDLVVLRLRDVTDLEKTHKLLVPGGFLYWEMPPLTWAAFLRQRANGANLDLPKRWRRVPNLFHDHVAALERLGLHDIQMHWQRPNFDACLEIIPLNETTLDYAFARPRSDLASRIKFTAGKLMMQTGLLTPLAPCFSLIGRVE